jgi:glycogen(starch) synthase
LGIFPSYYEPWGYTPVECMALALPAVASDLSGFGSYLMQNLPDYRSRGLLVVHRRMTSYKAALDELTEYLWNFVHLDRRERIALRNAAEESSIHFDWQKLIENYRQAYHEVLYRTGRHEVRKAG